MSYGWGAIAEGGYGWGTFVDAIPDTTPPALVSATVVGGTVLKLTFDEAVTFGAGGNTGWTITMSGGAATLTYSSGDGTSVLLYSISRSIEDTETGTTAYTQPGNGVEDIAGNELATIASQAVTISKGAQMYGFSLNGAFSVRA